MKHNTILALLVIALLLFILSLPASGQGGKKPRREAVMTVKVDFILRDGDSTEVWVKRRRQYNQSGYVWYMAKNGGNP